MLFFKVTTPASSLVASLIVDARVPDHLVRHELARFGRCAAAAVRRSATSAAQRRQRLLDDVLLARRAVLERRLQRCRHRVADDDELLHAALHDARRQRLAHHRVVAEADAEPHRDADRRAPRRTHVRAPVARRGAPVAHSEAVDVLW